MPFASKAQRRKFYQLRAQGKISAATVREWEQATGHKRLPERVKPKRKR